MRLSTKSRYAVTSLLDLVMHSDQGPVSLADISIRQGISLSYLEQLFAALRGKNLVRGVRGPGGGYYLAKPSDNISITDIICAVDEWVDNTRSAGRTNWRDSKPCLTHARAVCAVGNPLILHREKEVENCLYPKMTTNNQ